MKRLADYQTLAHTLLLSAACTVPLAGQSVAPASDVDAATLAQYDSNRNGVLDPDERAVLDRDRGTSVPGEEVIVLSPFEVTTEETEGYSAATTLAGNRLNTELRDIGNAVQVVTSQFLRDIGAVNNETLLQYTTNTEVGSIYGNFAGVGDAAQLSETDKFKNPSQNTRVRGLTAADNTRDYFLTDIPWDSYNVDRVDLQRGPNSILFGQGSPAGIINSGTKTAAFANSGEFEFRFDNFSSSRASIDYNRELIDDELAVRVNLLRDNQKFKQEPAYALSERGSAALRWEPAFLKRGSARTILKINAEIGDIESNRPRTLPPGDYITPWFETGTYEGTYRTAGPLIGGGTAAIGDPRTFSNLNKFTTNPHIAQNDNFYRADIPHGLTRPSINGGPFGGYVNPHYNPWIGNFGQSFGGPIAFYALDNGGPANYWNMETRETYGIAPDGTSDGSLGYDFNRLIGINSYSAFARSAGLEFAEFGIYKNRHLTDATVFDFYNNLIDGPNKEEWQDFDVYNISLAQTFFNDKLGVELSYNAESYENGQLSLLTDSRQGIYIDINDRYADGTHDGTGTYPDNIPFNDGTVNPNLGRPFITDSAQFGNNSFRSDRHSRRATAFFTHDFEREGRSSGWLTRLLGRHTFTGLWAQDQRDTDERNWQRYAVLDPAYRRFLNLGTSTLFTDNAFAPNHVIYLGPSLLNASTASGAYIPRPRSVFTATDGMMWIFDSHWANNGVDPGAEWLNGFYPSDPDTNQWYIDNDANNPHFSTQSENPANYVGWRQIPITITDSEAAPGNRDLLTTSARKQRRRTTSRAVVWQGHLWDNALVGTYGVRKDRAEAWSVSLNTNSPSSHTYGHLDLSPDNYALPEEGDSIEETSRSWSAVLHLNQLPVLNEALERLPVFVSAFYADSENFQPEAGRVDVYGEAIPLPSGKTKEVGLLFETKDGKYTFKINKYETEAKFAPSNALNGAWFIGASQVWSGNWVNRFEYDLGVNPGAEIIQNQVNNRPEGASNPPGWGPTFREGNPDFDPTNSFYNYDRAPGETLEQAQAREASVIQAWRQWQASVDPRFYEAWGIDLNAPFRETDARALSSSNPNGFALTEDSVSEGYEFEFTAQPLRNWRIALNASKTEATRSNIGGANLKAFIDAYEAALGDGEPGSAGDLRIWWGGAGNETALFQWYANVGSEWAQRELQEGTNVPELREWHVTAITNYDFTTGFLRGVNVGGGMRYLDSVVIGYRPVPGATARELSFDIANPYTGPSETYFDFWIGYGRRIADKVDWRIQLNVRNAFTGDELIPITAQPDGTPAAFRIAPPRTWTVTNTFRF